MDSDGTFTLLPNGATQSTKTNTSESHSNRLFRPFGILEPSSAKAARNDIAKALALVCEIATTKYRLQELDEEYCKTKQALALAA